MEIANTTINGAQAVTDERGDMTGMVCNTAITKKYMLANLLNCNTKDSKLDQILLGRKLYHVYFDVLTKLDSKLILFYAKTSLPEN